MVGCCHLAMAFVSQNTHIRTIDTLGSRRLLTIEQQCQWITPTDRAAWRYGEVANTFSSFVRDRDVSFPAQKLAVDSC